MKVLIVRLSSIGDVIQGIPCLVALKESFRDWEISWLVEEASAPVLRGHPCLASLFVVRRRWRRHTALPVAPGSGEHGSGLWATWQGLKQQHFDIAIDLQGLLKSGIWTWLSGAPRRIGHNRTREFAHLFLNEYAGDRPVFDPSFPLVERYLEPAKFLGADIRRARYLLPPSSAETVSHVDRLLSTDTATGKRGNRPTVALCPWSAWPSKNWPMEPWRAVAKELCADHRVVLIGTGADLPDASRLCAEIPDLVNLTGKTSLPDLVEVFRRCQLAIGPDSGPLHLANATAVPRVIIMFGSTSWRRSGPFGTGHRTISTELPCQPCFARVCPLGHLKCQHSITPDEVLRTIREVTRAGECSTFVPR